VAALLVESFHKKAVHGINHLIVVCHAQVVHPQRPVGRVDVVAGEIGWERMQEGEGNSSYRNRIIDAIFCMDGETLEKRARIEAY
jgi:hypothetical protein